MGIEVLGENLNFWKPWPSPFLDDRNYYLLLTPQGSVGIGKIPTHFNFCLDVKGDVYANNLQLTSDERLKTDIQSLSLTNRVSSLYKLNGKSYKKQQIEEQFESEELKSSKKTFSDLKQNDSQNCQF